jgi:hypothetical protein
LIDRAGRERFPHTAKSCGSGAPTLALSWRRCSSIVPMTGARKPGPREEREGNRKTIAQGMPSCFGVPVVTKACVLSSFAHKAVGAAEAPGIPCALFLRVVGQTTRARSRRGSVNSCKDVIASSDSCEAIQCRGEKLDRFARDRDDGDRVTVVTQIPKANRSIPSWPGLSTPSTSCLMLS